MLQTPLGALGSSFDGCRCFRSQENHGSTQGDCFVASPPPRTRCSGLGRAGQGTFEIIPTVKQEVLSLGHSDNPGVVCVISAE